MIRKSISALLFSCITLAGIGCWDFGYEENQYVSPFDENILVAPDLMPFLFSAHDFHWSFDSLTKGNLLSSEDRWVEHFQKKYSKKDIEQLIVDWSNEDFQHGLMSKQDTFNNPLLTDLRNGKHPLERRYLLLAHQSSSFKQRDEWANFFSWWDISYKIETEEDARDVDSATTSDGTENGINVVGLEREKKKEAEAARLQDSLLVSRTRAREELIRQFEQLRGKTSSKELQERIDYQILVLNYYQPMGGNFEKIFKKTYPQPQPKSIFYWMAYDHWAGTPTRESQEDHALDWVRIFLNAPSLRKGAMASFPEQNDDSWEGLMNCTQNKEEKVGLWLMLATQQPEITAYAFEQALQISPHSPLTDLLMVREIQLLEGQFHLQENRLKTYPYTPGITYEYQGWEVKQQLKELAFRWNALFRKHENNLTETQHLGWAYLQHLAGYDEDAVETLQDFHPQNGNIQRSKKVFQILVQQQLNYREGWNEKQDQQTAKDLEWLSQFPEFDRISMKKGWSYGAWENSNGISDVSYDGRIFESNETYPYAAMRDGLRIYLYEYMRHRSEEEDPFENPTAPKSLAMWFLSPHFNVYDYPENWDAAGIVELIHHPEHQSKTDRWFFQHLPSSISQTVSLGEARNWEDSTFSLPINADFWNEIAGELSLQRRDYLSANTFFNSIQHPERFPRLKLNSNPLLLPSMDVSDLANSWFNIRPITDKIALSEALAQLSQRTAQTEMSDKQAMACWIQGILEFNTSYAGNSWNASRYAWSYNDPEVFQTDGYWRKNNLPDEKYFDSEHPKKLVFTAYQHFETQKKGKEFAAGCAISLLQMNIDGNDSYWSYRSNTPANHQSAMMIEWLQTKFSKTKTFRTFEKNCPEYEVYALSNWD